MDVSMKINLKGTVAIVGNYGSGKTEVAVNLALASKNNGLKVKLADLDLVNPYFRTREARKTLTERGIDVILPDAQYMDADLPILTPRIYGMLQDPSELNILDAGGDDVGTTVLAALTHLIDITTIQVLQVVNPHRPHSETIEGCLKLRKDLESVSKLKITGIIGNANLIEETTPAHIHNGYEFVNAYAHTSQLELKFITAPSHLIPAIDFHRISCPVLPVMRQMVPPWKKPMRLGPASMKIFHEKVIK